MRGNAELHQQNIEAPFTAKCKFDALKDQQSRPNTPVYIYLPSPTVTACPESST
jgi:hypothetical protein